KSLLEQVGLSHRLNYSPNKLSGGEKQRVAIARALINDPEVIFADEPTGNLDSKSGAQVMKILQDLNDKGHTIILVTHEKSTAEHAERIIRVKDGNILDDCKVDCRLRANDDEELKK
ncbi:MAG: ATP-binding cassette domain-containing protein, partial [Candidatus Paceibacterota bacterium]